MPMCRCASLRRICVFLFFACFMCDWVAPEFPGGPFWQAPGRKLTATVEVLDLLLNGTIPLPSGTRRIFLEVGANSEATMDTVELSDFPDSFLVSFEPLLHHYSALIARSVQATFNSMKPLGAHHARGVAVPFAVSPEEGFADLRIAGPYDACASLLQERSPRHRWDCANPRFKSDIRRVPTVSLQTVLGSWLAWEDGGGWPVDFLKVDAQGFDIEVLKSAGDNLPRIKRVLLEVPRDSCDRMYEGSLHCSEIVAAMKAWGFTPAYGRQCSPMSCKHGNVQEEDWEFLRDGVRPLYDGKRPKGHDCWRQRLVDGGSIVDLQRFRHMCCGCAHISSVSLVCFEEHYQMDRCCIGYNISSTCPAMLNSIGEVAILHHIRRLLGQ